MGEKYRLRVIHLQMGTEAIGTKPIVSRKSGVSGIEKTKRV